MGSESFQKAKQPDSRTRRTQRIREGRERTAEKAFLESFASSAESLRNLCGRLRFIVLSLEQSDEILPI
jgi:hypothetical protein